MFDYPFTAVVGQHSFKLALILAAINPKIGGVLISGPRGSAKSTLARALANVLPEAPPFVTLPLGATEEKVIGTLDLEQVLNEKKLEFSPGLLAKAHNGVLYIDEVNLLADGLVDVLLDVATSGVNRVERDGITHRHPAEFILVGTMNPEEGELRPQLLDRFGLMVELNNDFDISQRIEIVRRREAFDADPERFCQMYGDKELGLTRKIKSARLQSQNIQFPEDLRQLIAERCQQAGVDGLRADIVWHRAASAHAAWQGHSVVTEDDVNVVADLVLAHRRQNPQKPIQHSSGKGSDQLRTPQTESSFSRVGRDKAQQKEPETRQGSDGNWGTMAPVLQKIQPVPDSGFNIEAATRLLKQNNRRVMNSQGGKRSGRAVGNGRIKEPTGSTPNWFATLRACWGRWPPTKIEFRKRPGGEPVWHLVLLDTSASTLTNQQFGKAKWLVAEIARHAYRSRDQLTVFGFGNDQVDCLLPKISSQKKVVELLDNLKGGGGTPLKEALEQIRSFISWLRLRHPEFQIETYLLTDGRFRDIGEDIKLDCHCTVIDIEQAAVKRGKAKELSKVLGASYFAIANSPIFAC